MSIYQHFREEEYGFIDQALSWKDMVLKSYQPYLTDFLDPREQQIIKMIIGENNEEINLAFSLEKESTERKRAVLAPFYENINEENFDIVLMQATYANKFINLTHRDVMGAFLSLGIERTKLGDIFVDDGLLQFVTTNDIAPYILMNLTRIKNANIQLEEKPLSDIVIQKDKWMENDHVVSSLRLDVVLKSIYRLSRKHAATYITKKQVKLNHKTVDDVSYVVYEGDLISVRGLGRSKILQVSGRTRKNKVRITTGLLK